MAKFLFLLLFSQLPILLAYSFALTQLEGSLSRAVAFAASVVLSVGLLALIVGWPDSLAQAGWMLIAFGVPSSAMLLGSFGCWVFTRKRINSYAIQILIATAAGIVAFVVGTVIAFALIMELVGDFHI